MPSTRTSTPNPSPQGQGDRLDRRVVALDGKSLRGAARSAGRSTPPHLVMAWAADQRLVLAQRAAPNRSTDRGPSDEVEPLQTRYDALSQGLDPAGVLRVVRAHRSIVLREPQDEEQPALAARRRLPRGRHLHPQRHDLAEPRPAAPAALAILRQDATKAFLHTKRRLAGRDDDYIADLISQMR